MKKKILFILSSLTFGGAEKQTIALVNSLDKRLCDVSLVYIKKTEGLLSSVDKENLSLFCLEKKSKFDIGGIIKLSKIIQKINPDGIVCVNPYPLLYTKLSGFFSQNRSKVITVLHSTRERKLYNRLIVRFLYRFLINTSDFVIFVCKAQMHYWLSTYKIKSSISRVIYNGVDVEYFSEDQIQNPAYFREKLNINTHDFVIVICATLRAEKQHKLLIEAGKALMQESVPVKLLLVGDGPEKNAVSKTVDELGMDKNTIFAGFQSNVRPYLAVADVFVLVSSTETFSMAILEAMAMEKAIVAPEIGGVPEQVKNGVNGYTFSSGDIKELTIALRKIYDEQTQTSMGKASRKRVVQSFSEAKMLAGYVNLFNSL